MRCTLAHLPWLSVFSITNKSAKVTSWQKRSVEEVLSNEKWDLYIPIFPREKRDGGLVLHMGDKEMPKPSYVRVDRLFTVPHLMLFPFPKEASEPLRLSPDSLQELEALLWDRGFTKELARPFQADWRSSNDTESSQNNDASTAKTMRILPAASSS